MHPALADLGRNISNAMAKSPDVVIFGAGIAGLWTFHRLKRLGYDVLLLEKEFIGGGQTIASQGIIHSGLKFTLVGKVNKLAKSISKMPQRWRASLEGNGDVDIQSAVVNAQSQNLLIPAGFMGGIKALITQKTLGETAHEIPIDQWPEDIKKSGFRGSIIFMDELVLNIPTVIRALAEPYRNSIKKLTLQQAACPMEFLEENDIKTQYVVLTSAASNHEIAKHYGHAKGLETQKRPLMQAMLKPAPFPLFAHFVGKTDKPVASVTTHETENGTLVWYLGGGVAERKKEDDPKNLYKDMIESLKKYLPACDFSKIEWAELTIDRIEGESKTDHWMPNTPTIHRVDNVLYCWPTKLTFAPLLSDMILNEIEKRNITPSQKETDFSFLPSVDYATAPWDKAKWKK